jgi:hypothetical protein
MENINPKRKAGRPKLPPEQKAYPVALRLTPAQKLIYTQVGGARWVARMIDRLSRESDFKALSNN